MIYNMENMPLNVQYLIQHKGYVVEIIVLLKFKVNPSTFGHFLISWVYV